MTLEIFDNFGIIFYNFCLTKSRYMYIKLIRNKPQGNAITGRLVIDGRWFCYTLERKGVEIPALCYHVAVTQSPKFKRLLPLVTGVPRTMSNVESQKSKVNETSAAVSPDFKHSTLDIKQSALRSGIRIHRGSKPEHSSGCVLVVGDNKNDNTDNLRGNQLPAALKENISFRSRDILISLRSNDRLCRTIASGTLSPLSSNKPNIGCRSAAEVETQLTQLLLQTQNAHEEIILEVTDFRPGTELGYNTPCPPELQKP